MQQFKKPIRCVVIGDGDVGKTSMLLSYTRNEFSDDYMPTIFENITTTLNVDGQNVVLNLWDTAGQEDYDKLRVMAYPNTDVIVLCVSTVCVTSFDNIKTRWVPEIRRYCPNVPILLVGTKIDLRDEILLATEHRQSKSIECVLPAQGEKLARKIKAVKYLECSAKNQTGLARIFNDAVRVVVWPRTISARRHKLRYFTCGVF